MPATRPSSLAKPLHSTLSIFLTACLATLAPATAMADDDDIGFADKSVCVAPLIEVPGVLLDAPDGPLEAQEIGLEGDSMEMLGTNKITMTGNAQVIQGARGVFADKIVYDQETYFAELEGNVLYYSEYGDEIKTDTMRMDVDTFLGETGQAELRTADRKGLQRRKSVNFVEDYSFLAPLRNPRDQVEADERKTETGPRTENRIWADKIEIEGESFQRVHNAAITRCPEGEDVMIYGDEVELDQAEGVGYAKDVTVKFKGVPILWAPAFSFPLNDQRKTGFLAPSVGDDEKSGLILATPYYFNLSENYDATLRPTYYQNRGLQMFGEFRYLTDTGNGAIRGEYLPGDDLFNDEDRYGYAANMNHNYSNGWGVQVNLADVSDTSYLNDFRNDINLTSATYLQQRGQLSYNNSYIYARGIASIYNEVAPDLAVSSPYDRLPQLAFGVRPQTVGPFELGLDSELITFDHDDSGRVTGTRLNVIPSIEMPYEPIYGYVKPKLAFHAISYQLDNLGSFDDDAPSVGVPIFSVDSGLFFEREASFMGKAMTHTLEPRLMYVYAPEENQDDLPVFDTGEGSVSSYSVLFREERFFGGDRVGDDNHIALGVTTRMISEKTGQERARASIGQLYYLSDREVGISPSSSPATENKSDIFAELNAVLTNEVDIRSFLQWDQEEGEFSNTTIGIDYEAGYRRNVSLDYYKNNVSSEDLYLQLDWPLAPRWQFSTSQRYSIEDGDFRESSYGLIYDGCCWAVGIRGSNTLQSDGEYNAQFVVTFELDGLGRVQTGL